MRSRPRIPFAALALATAAWPAAAQVVPADLLNRIATLESRTTTAGTALTALQTQTSANAGLIGTQGGTLASLGASVDELRTRTASDAAAIGGLRTDLGGLRATLDTGLSAVGARLNTTSAKVADIEVQLGDLRGVLGGLDVPDVIDVTGPVDVSDLVRTLNRQVVATAANAGLVAAANVSIDGVRERNAVQDERLADHEVRIAQNTASLAAHAVELDDHERRITKNTADIAGLQTQMADGFAGISNELEAHSRRIDKATEGVAIALAMKSPAVPDDKSFAVSGSFGAFDGQTALAFAGGVRASDALQFDAGLAVGLDRGSVGGRAGATLAW